MARETRRTGFPVRRNSDLGRQPTSVNTWIKLFIAELESRENRMSSDAIIGIGLAATSLRAGIARRRMTVMTGRCCSGSS
jgi:hypothetical protein